MESTEEINKNAFFQSKTSDILDLEELDQVETTSETPCMSMPSNEAQKARFRPVIIDGCNIGFLYGRTEDKFRAEGLQIVYEYFKKIGYENSQIVIIQSHISQKYLTENDQCLMKNLHQIGVLHYCPSRFAGDELIKSDDDLLILKTAYENQGIVLSNDQFRQYKSTYPKYYDYVKYKLVQANFILNQLSLPDDPLGVNGPNLEQFLRFDK